MAHVRNFRFRMFTDRCGAFVLHFLPSVCLSSTCLRFISSSFFAPYGSTTLGFTPFAPFIIHPLSVNANLLSFYSDHSISKRGGYRELHEYMTNFLIEKWGKGGRKVGW
jgi:hypothetical protein